MTLIKPHASCGCLVTLEMATAQPPSVLALPGAWPWEVGRGTALASCAAVARWRFPSVHASAHQSDPVAIAFSWSFNRTPGRLPVLVQERSGGAPPPLPLHPDVE